MTSTLPSSTAWQAAPTSTRARSRGRPLVRLPGRQTDDQGRLRRRLRHDRGDHRTAGALGRAARISLSERPPSRIAARELVCAQKSGEFDGPALALRDALSTNLTRAGPCDRRPGRGPAHTSLGAHIREEVRPMCPPRPVRRLERGAPVQSGPMSHPLVVMKFGGSSVANADRIRRVARRIARARAAGADLCIVVSAMGDTTDELLALAAAITEEPDPRELDMLLATGEHQSATLVS